MYKNCHDSGDIYNSKFTTEDYCNNNNKKIQSNAKDQNIMVNFPSSLTILVVTKCLSKMSIS